MIEAFKKASTHVDSTTRSATQHASHESLVSVPASSTLSCGGDARFSFSDSRPAKRTKFSFSTPTVSNSSTTNIEAASNRNECFLPGFKVTNVSPSFVRQCSICHRSSVLALILKVQNLVVAPNKNVTSKFLSNISLDEIFFRRVCCDSCASYIIEPTSSLLPEPVSGAVVLVGIKENMNLWLKRLNRVFFGAYIGVSEEKWLEYFEDNLGEISLTDEDKGFKDALAWVAKGFEESFKIIPIAGASLSLTKELD
ncbi:hypothetical protein BDZ45DRAFT_97954 [Acephala macrosclerotiorum]|nr:hypothetical protein BDZ45DRAFT_97954 [Acephala macrosclerotiorum]